jgi:exo-1,4-beta-D-glucosaminidase
VLGIPSLLVAVTLALACAEAPAPTPETTVRLQDGWKIVAAAAVTAAESEVATAGFDTSGWTPTRVPSTVLAALVRDGQVEDPYFGKNLEAIPTGQFEHPWWYRTELTLDRPPAPGARLVFEGINYRADVWLNGQKIGDREELLGAFRLFALDVSAHLVAGVNALAVKVYPPEPGDPTIGFVDWNPIPPDRNMGLWRGVELRLSGGVALDDVFVRSDVDLESLAKASLTVTATLRNDTDRRVTTVVAARIGDDIELEHREALEPRQERRIELSPARFDQLVIDRPRLWWPNGLGEPELYELAMTVSVDGRIADRRELSFGIRHVADYLTEEGHRGYAVNGKKLLIRGGGWVDDLLLADDDRKLEDQIRYVRHMNLNTIRLEGFWGSSHKLFELADRYGILVMIGWSCQWEWEEYLGGPVDEFGGIDTPAEIELITRSLRDQVVWLRNHPSVFVWVLGSDMLPRPQLETSYRTALAEIDPTRPVLASCAVAVSEVSGPSGVKMNGPYEWVPPNYWYLDRERGGAYGFNTETGPGPQPPPVESIRRMMPEENWWPIDELWDYHCGRNEFNTLDRYKKALDNRYGPAADLEEFARTAQLANYEGMRAMFEAFSIRRPATTGIIQWMLNSAWPEMYWQLYDHYLVPNGAFYGARDASRPINIAFDYEDRGIVVVNDTASRLAGITASVQVLDLQSEVLFEQAQRLDLPPETLRKVLTVPTVAPGGKAYFVDARITATDGTQLASSLYWLSTEPDVPNWEASEWFYTPTASYADLTGLARLPRVELEVEHRFEETADGQAIHVSLANPSDKLAFFIELKVVGSESGRMAAPILWSDNYVSLAPGETRQIHGEIPAHALVDEAPVFHYEGINVNGA